MLVLALNTASVRLPSEQTEWGVKVRAAADCRFCHNILLLFYCHTCRHLLSSSPHFVFQFAAGVSLRTSRYNHDSSVWQTEAVLQHKQTNFTLFHLIYGTLFSQGTLYRVWLVSGCMMITWDVCSFSPTSSKMCVTPFLFLNNPWCASDYREQLSDPRQPAELHSCCWLQTQFVSDFVPGTQNPC